MRYLNDPGSLVKSVFGGGSSSPVSQIPSPKETARREAAAAAKAARETRAAAAAATGTSSTLLTPAIDAADIQSKKRTLGSFT